MIVCEDDEKREYTFVKHGCNVFMKCELGTVQDFFSLVLDEACIYETLLHQGVWPSMQRCGHPISDITCFGVLVIELTIEHIYCFFKI